ncbi:hypothetical protein ABOM_006516 [Aspergillus bombycis]|uniref:Uncharacterized protein n=1 Tax=Aspergillus bombycis TaxID=109264 RepID=A0A1F8A1C3_9EURO|nr:hypothetical protein ABOM_006516 [Aspergillus bombycis]OGM45503.1 hypothetical protein ABOM_006516 [Aspergillus bombycis]
MAIEDHWGNCTFETSYGKTTRAGLPGLSRQQVIAAPDRALLRIWRKEERPFGLYRRYTLVLRGEHWLNKEKAMYDQISGRKGSPKDRMVSVIQSSSTWRAQIMLPLHAVLVDVKLVDQVKEDEVKVHHVVNPVVQAQMLKPAKRSLSTRVRRTLDMLCLQQPTCIATMYSGISSTGVLGIRMYIREKRDFTPSLAFAPFA